MVILMITDWDSYQNDRLVGGIFMSQAMWMAKAILKTRDCWSDRTWDAENTDMVDEWTFEAWVNAMVTEVYVSRTEASANTFPGQMRLLNPETYN
ncbi:hypothetical protein ACQKWADRAFT_315378 [Trichoderma austrokoningii]